MNTNIIGLIAIIFGVIGMALGGYAVMTDDEGPIGPEGPVGSQGTQGEKGDTGEPGPSPEFEWNETSIRFINPDGTWGDWIDLIGPKGPKGSTGSSGADGQDGTDLEPNECPVIVEHTMDGDVCYEDDWLFMVNISDSEDDLMKIEGYLMLDMDWLPYGYLEMLFGEHYWIPMFNEVGTSGVYEFDATNIRDMIESEWGTIMYCVPITWRVDIMDGENFISEEYTFTPCPCCL